VSVDSHTSQPIAGELAAKLAGQVDGLVPNLLAGARRCGGYWRAGDTAGAAGQSLYVHRAGPRIGRWRDTATDEGGDMLDLIAAARRVTLREAIAWARTYLGGEAPRSESARSRLQPAKASREALDDDAHKRQAAALAIWRESRPAAGTIVEAYLRGRGITLPVPLSIRFHPALKYGPTGMVFPAMVAAVQAPDRSIVAIHRTYLRPDGSGKANVASPKMTLGPLGHGAVRLGPTAPVMGIAEGIETALSAQQLHGVTTWAALGCRLGEIEPPFAAAHLMIFRDNGEAGEQAAERVRQAQRSQGRRVTIKAPPAGLKDWNDCLATKERAA
jgi:hypothetical protein